MKGSLVLVFVAALTVLVMLLSGGCTCLDLIDELSPGSGPSRPVAPSPAKTPAALSPTPALPSPTPAAGDERPPLLRPFTPLPPPPFPPAGTRVSKTGTLTLGNAVQLGGQAISQSGGEMTLKAPGTPLDGMVMDIPAGTYNETRTFKVSFAPISATTFENVKAVSPLITIDNGGGYSEEVMTVKVPVRLSAGQFAMGFFYDPSTRKLEGMPLLAQDSSSVTVATRHFSSFFISATDAALLKDDIDTGFRPGIDDWQFPNEGSAIAPKGHCAGQTLAVLWYYVTRPDGRDATLYNRYDRNGDKPATPLLWMDDSRGYRLCSVIHRDINWSKFEIRFFLNLERADPELTWRAFAYSMRVTGEPQYVGIRSKAGGGHAMIVYRIKDGNLYIADPNYPGNNNRRIEFANGAFKPYNSGDNAADIAEGKGKNYELIGYIAKTAFFDWSTIAARWQEFKAGTIGKDIFPRYTLVYRDDEGKFQNLTEGMVFNTNKIHFSSSLPNGLYVFLGQSMLPFDDQGRVSLSPGENQLGFYVVSKIGMVWQYLDFVYMKVIYQRQAASPTPAATPGSDQLVVVTTQLPAGKVGAAYSATLKASGGKPPYRWTYAGSLPGSFKLSPEGTISGTPTAAGNINFKVYVTDSGSPPQQAERIMVIAVQP